MRKRLLENDNSYEKEYLTITSLEDNNVISWILFGSSGAKTILVSTDKSTWTSVTSTTGEGTSLTLNLGEKIYIKGSNNTYASSTSLSNNVASTKLFIVSGNIMSLTYGDNFIGQTTLLSPWCYAYLFYACDKLVDASNLILPATTLTDYCYRAMFSGCSSLIKAPKLPATTLAGYCYYALFAGCAITKAPELSNATLYNTSCNYMFENCSSLNYIKCLSSGAANAHQAWVSNVAPEGVFIKNSNFNNWTLNSENGIPIGWTVFDEGETPIAWKESSFTRTLTNGPNQPRLVNPFNLPVTYSSSNTSIATINASGDLTYNGVGTTTLTATFAGDSKYNSKTVTCTLTIKSYSLHNDDYLTIVPQQSGSTVIKFICSNSSISRTIQVSTDNGITWETKISTVDGTTLATISRPEKLLIKGVYPTYSSSASLYNYFLFSNRVYIQGNIMSLVYGDGFIGKTTLTGSYNFAYLFSSETEGSNTIINISNLILPATSLTGHCYAYMFKNRLPISSSPTLPATTLAICCYSGMFYKTSALPDCSHIDFTSQTVVASGGLIGLFAGTNITDSLLNNILPTNPNTNKAYLPVTTLSSNCYESMFWDCTNLTTIPSGFLPATTLANYCYYMMFSGCTSLTTAPELPATTLASSCYRKMFDGCNSLTTAPELPATILTTYCYYYMFAHCTSLNYIKCLATDISATYCTFGWVLGVAASGTFIKSTKNSTWTTGNSGIPSGWTSKLIELDEYLTLEAIESGTFQFTKAGLSYSTNGGNTWTSLAANTATPTITAGNRILFKGTMTPSSSSTQGTGGVGTFSSTGNFSARGNPLSLLYGDNFEDVVDISAKNYAFYYLFAGCSKLIDASSLALVATTLSTSCYRAIFYNCSNLVTGPVLPATTLTSYCYTGMFNGCSSLISLPKLPATTMATYCYHNMFKKCSSITSIPSDYLPATTLASYCYYYMFTECNGLTTLPEGLLPATTLANSCYYDMFYSCAELVEVPDNLLPATTLKTNCYRGLFYNCPKLVRAPKLPAATLVTACYLSMFNLCSSLNYVNCLATTISTGLTSWLSGVSGVGTFIKHLNTTWPSGVSGIPSGWTILDSYETLYFTIVSLANSNKITLKALSSSLTVTVQVSTDNGATWTSETSTTSGVTLATLASGGKLLIKRDSNTRLGDTSYYNYFTSTLNFTVEGNIMSLLYGDRFTGKYTLTPTYAFLYLFYNCTKLTSAANLILPATTLSTGCYRYMFRGCTSLTTAPELPAITLVDSCYYYMFYGCSVLNYIKCLATNTSASNCTYYWVYNIASTGTFVKNSNKTWTTGVSNCPSGWTVTNA